MPRRKHPYLCYMIYSESTRRVYVGISNDFEKRLHNHNHTKAGARFTKRGRPWRLVMQVCGFADRNSAEKFEWAWQHPARTRHLRHARARGLINKCRSLKNWATAAIHIANCDAWKERYTHLHVQFVPPRLRKTLLPMFDTCDIVTFAEDVKKEMNN